MCEQRIRTLNSKCGMTLVELLVVMVILSVVMLAVMSLYIPIQQSTVAQTQVSDVQSNLKLAINTMTRDLLTAGFLATRHPIVFPDANTAPDFGSSTLADIGTHNSSDFIIRTRAVGSGFARVDSANYSVSTFVLTVTDLEMVLKFPVGSKVRIFGSMNGEELIGAIDDTIPSDKRVLEVTAISGATISLDASVATLSTDEKDALEASLVEAVVVRVRDDSQPALQTIRYRLNSEGGLERIVNGNRQILARNMDSVFFGFSPATGRISLVDVKLTGKTKALKDDAISGAKTREIETSVRLRNVF